MDKPIHFDGSQQLAIDRGNDNKSEVLTGEARKTMSGNPFVMVKDDKNK